MGGILLTRRTSALKLDGVINHSLIPKHVRNRLPGCPSLQSLLKEAANGEDHVSH